MMEDSAFAALLPYLRWCDTELRQRIGLGIFSLKSGIKNFPKNQIQKGQFEEINNGFKKETFLLYYNGGL